MHAGRKPVRILRDKMQVSVIIPVYNAERYVREAVESALSQSETGEVILIEDASPDDSLQVCRELAREFEKVRLLRHADGKNHGAGASRNLGIINARFDYIAFLDADDFFLPGRFSVAKQLFEADSQIEGVYEAVGYHFESESSYRRWRKRREERGANLTTTLTTMKERVPPERLFEAQAPVGSSGYCPTGGWVVKRSVFDKTGLFDEHLRLYQDSAMYVKFAAVGRMVPGRLDEPVAIRRVHDHNRSSVPRSPADVYKGFVLMWATLWRWGKRNLDEARHHILLKRFIRYAARPYNDKNSQMINHFQSVRQLSLLVLQYPELCSETFFRKTWTRHLVNSIPYGYRLLELVKALSSAVALLYKPANGVRK